MIAIGSDAGRAFQRHCTACVDFDFIPRAIGNNMGQRGFDQRFSVQGPNQRGIKWRVPCAALCRKEAHATSTAPACCRPRRVARKQFRATPNLKGFVVVHDTRRSPASLKAVLMALVLGGPFVVTHNRMLIGWPGVFANERAVLQATVSLNLSPPYALPVPIDQPIEFLIARAVYNNNAEKFRIHIEQVRSTFAGLKKQMNDASSLNDSAQDVLKSAQRLWTSDMSGMYTVEIGRNEYLNATIVGQLVKASSGISDAASYRNLLRDRIKQTLVEHREKGKMSSQRNTGTKTVTIVTTHTNWLCDQCDWAGRMQSPIHTTRGLLWKTGFRSVFGSR